MSYASQVGRARVSIRDLHAQAVCDRCGIWYSINELKWQVDWRGTALANLRILVCPSCFDRPQEQLRSIVLPPDPEPIINARPENFTQDETDYRSLSQTPVLDPTTGIPVPSTTLRITQNCENLVNSPYGEPLGLEQNAIMPQALTNGVPTQYGRVLPVLSIYSSGCLVTVTCSAIHGLTANDQVSVLGLTSANGFYSVQVPTATVFTFQTASPQNPQLTNAVRIVTAQVGLPRGFTDFPV
jgi:hypothetical protein